MDDDTLFKALKGELTGSSMSVSTALALIKAPVPLHKALTVLRKNSYAICSGCEEWKELADGDYCTECTLPGRRKVGTPGTVSAAGTLTPVLGKREDKDE